MRDWENLRYFLSVARQGTVSGAARELGVSHSTVLRRIEQFESVLDTKLFKKLQRGYELSPAGERLFSSGVNIQSDIDRVFAEAEGQHDVAAGKLRISQPETGIINIYPLYAKFALQHPDTVFEVHSTMAAHNLNQQEVDIAFRISDSPPDLLVGRCLGDITVRLYASKNYLKRLQKNHGVNDYDWVMWQMTPARTAQDWLAHNVIDPRIVLHAETMPDVVSAVRNDMGVAFLSSHEARNHPELVTLLGGHVIAQYKLWLLTHRDLRNSERVKTFMRFMADNLQLE